MSITENLIQALLRIRAKVGNERRFWADQICINQADFTEKSAQVSLMSRIFPSCRRVICWLGEEDEHTTSAFEILNAWARAEGDEKLRTQLSRDLSTDTTGDASSHVAKRAALSSLFSRTWFRRVWILQEIFVSLEQPPMIVCGSCEMGWTTFCVAFVTICTTLGSWDPAIVLGDNVRFFVTMFDVYFNREVNKVTLSRLIQQASQREATDPRDRIFALLGIMEQQGFHYPKPDYELTNRQVFVKYTRAMIEQDGNLDMLGMRRRTWAGDDLPSWVLTPGRIYVDAVVFLIWRERLVYDNGGVTGHSKPMMGTPVSDFDEELVLDGHQMDRVSQIHDLTEFRRRISSAGKRWRDVVECVQDLTETLGLTKTYAHTGENLPVACLRMFVVDDFFLACPQVTRNYDLEVGKLYNRYLRDQLEGNLKNSRDTGAGAERNSHESSWTSENLYELAKRTFRFELEGGKQSTAVDARILEWMDSVVSVDLANRILLKISGASLALTQSNLIALVPNNSKVGDDVALLMGGFLPFVLREVEGSGKYTLIGEAYVYGLLRGRGMNKVLAPCGLHAPEKEGLTTFCLT